MPHVWALHDFFPTNDDEIQLTAGERILAYAERYTGSYTETPGWLTGKNSSGKIGLFPKKYTTSTEPARALRADSAAPVAGEPAVLNETGAPGIRPHTVTIPPAAYFPNSRDVDIEKGISTSHTAKLKHPSPSVSSFATVTDASTPTERFTLLPNIRSFRFPDFAFPSHPPSKIGQWCRSPTIASPKVNRAFDRSCPRYRSNLFQRIYCGSHVRL